MTDFNDVEKKIPKSHNIKDLRRKSHALSWSSWDHSFPCLKEYDRVEKPIAPDGAIRRSRVHFEPEISAANLEMKRRVAAIQ